MDRRTIVLDAAATVAAEGGMRGLTHRAVDAAAGLAAGSTSNVFRTRARLVEALVEHLAAVEFDQVQSLLPAGAVPSDYAAALAAFAVADTTGAVQRSRARFALSMDPISRADVVAARSRLVTFAASMLAEARHPAAATAAELALAVVDGIAFTTAVLGRPVDRDAVSETLRALIV